MKTKYLLFSLALSVGFTACTSEFEQFQTSVNQGQVALKDRASGKVVLSATRDGSAETRMIAGFNQDGKSLSWFWEKDDMIGGVMVDTETRGVPASYDPGVSYGFSNHPYTSDVKEGKAGSANFNTNTVVQEGVYVFYHGYDGTNTGRGNVETSLKDQNVIVEGKEEANGLSQIASANKNRKEGQNFFISPLVDMSVAYEAENIVPITMKSIYYVLQLNLTADVEDTYINKGFEINKIILKTNDGEKFKKSFILNPTELGKAGLDAAKKLEAAGNDAYKCFSNYGVIEAYRYDLTGADKNKNLKLIDDAMKATVEEMEDDYNINASAAETERLVYTFEENPVYKAAGDTKSVMLLVPAGKYDKGVTVEVYTSEGVWKYTTAENKTNFTYGNTGGINKSLILKGDGTSNIENYDFTKGFPVDTQDDYEFALEYIAKNGNIFTASNYPVFNFGTGATITLKNGFPAYKARYNGDATLVLPTNETFDPTEQIFGVDADGKPAAAPVVKISKGVTLTVNKTVAGNLYVAGSADESGTYGTVVVNGDVNVTFNSMTIGTLNIGAESDVTVKSPADTDIEIGNLIVAAKGTLTTASGKNVVLNNAAIAGTTASFGNKNVIVNETVTFNGNTSGIATLTNNGTVTIGEKVTATTVVNNASLTVEDGGGLYADVINNKTVTVEMGGLLDAENFNNKAAASKFVLSGEGAEEGESLADIETLINNGDIEIQKPVNDKLGAWGGNLNVNSLTNNKENDLNGDAKTYNGTINNNGHLKVTSGKNNYEISLEDWDYAYLELTGGLTGDGVVRINYPSAYPKKMNERENNIAGGGKVVARFANTTDYESEYNKGVGYAWPKLDIIEIAGDVTVKNDNSKEYHLLSGNTILNGNVTLGNVFVKGNVSIVGTSDDTNTYDELTVTLLTVEEGKSLTIGADANMIFPGNAGGDVLIVNGNLVNRGSLNTNKVKGSVSTTIKTEIGKKGSLVNEGKMAEFGTNFVGDAVNTETATIRKYIAGDKGYKDPTSLFNCPMGANRFYVCETTTDLGDWKTQKHDLTREEITGFLSSSADLTKKTVGGYEIVYTQNYKSAVTDGYLYLWVDAGDADKLIEEVKNAKAHVLDGDSYYSKNILFGIQNDKVVGTAFDITNKGTLDLSFSNKLVNSDKSWAYGSSTQKTGAKIVGLFNNDPEFELAEE